MLLTTGEYTTGLIRATLTLVPRRLPVLWAKAVVFAGVAFALTLVTGLISFAVGQALLATRTDPLNRAPSAYRGMPPGTRGAGLLPWWKRAMDEEAGARCSGLRRSM